VGTRGRQQYQGLFDHDQLHDPDPGHGGHRYVGRLVKPVDFAVLKKLLAET